jgi:hypothetical protein
MGFSIDAFRPGDKIREWMEYSAKKADVFIFVVSPASLVEKLFIRA